MSHHQAVNDPAQVLALRNCDSIWADEAKARVLAVVEMMHAGLAEAGHQVVPIQIESPDALPEALQPYSPDEWRVFNMYEGVAPGECDLAEVTATLDQLGFTYTGADTRTLIAAQDKTCVKRVLDASAIPTPRWCSWMGNGPAWTHYPAIVKVADEHGSECLTAESVVYDEASLCARAVELNRLGFQNLLVAEFIDGPEFSVSVWGNGHLDSLPLVEVDFSDLDNQPRLRTYEAKWDESSPLYQQTRLVCPPQLAPELQAQIEQVAKAAYRTFDLRDYGRIDVRLRDNIPYVIDVNANPDLTPGSSFVMAAEQGGYAYSAMLDRILRLSLHRRRSNRRESI